MSKELNATCIICGKPYHCCLSCKNQTSFKPWRTITDTIDHYKIFSVLSDYNNGYLTKEKAKEQLDNIHFNIKELRESVQAEISAICETTQTTKKKAATETK